MTDLAKLKTLAEAASQERSNFGAGIPHREAFRAAANPAAVLELIKDAEQSEQDCKDVVGTIELRDFEIARLKTESEALRRDAERWRCVRNAIPMQSPYAVWREGSHVVLGKDADDLVDNFLSTKEKSHD